MPTYKITLVYDGTDFVGWQRQAEGVSIQAVVEEAVAHLAEREVAVAAAGRTDAGVHALGQVATFHLDRDFEPSTAVRALNGWLPPTVRVTAASRVEASFHARFAARAKTYRYRIWNGDIVPPFERRYVWHVPGPLDDAAMSEAATALEGERDFAAFQGTGSTTSTTVRTVYSSRVTRHLTTEDDLHFLRGGALISYEITGDGFLRHMVRAIVGSLVDVGRRQRPPSWLGDVLASCDRGRAGQTAPPQGLFLVAVDYGDL